MWSALKGQNFSPGANFFLEELTPFPLGNAGRTEGERVLIFLNLYPRVSLIWKMIFFLQVREESGAKL